MLQLTNSSYHLYQEYKNNSYYSIAFFTRIHFGSVQGITEQTCCCWINEWWLCLTCCLINFRKGAKNIVYSLVFQFNNNYVKIYNIILNVLKLWYMRMLTTRFYIIILQKFKLLNWYSFNIKRHCSSTQWWTNIMKCHEIRWCSSFLINSIRGLLLNLLFLDQCQT